jgi:hypothetical protein
MRVEGSGSAALETMRQTCRQLSARVLDKVEGSHKQMAAWAATAAPKVQCETPVFLRGALDWLLSGRRLDVLV